MAIVACPSPEVIDLLKAIGIADLPTLRVVIDIAVGEVVTVTPTIVLFAETLPAVKRFVESARERGLVVVNGLDLPDEVPFAEEVAEPESCRCWRCVQAGELYGVR